MKLSAIEQRANALHALQSMTVTEKGLHAQGNLKTISG